MGINIHYIHKKNLIHPSQEDLRVIKKREKAFLVPENISPSRSIKFAKKPWGYEYLCFKNRHLDIWEMRLYPNHCTSFHCHPKKDVLKIILEGKIKLETFRKSEILGAGKFKLIKGNTAHRTKNIGRATAKILEIESPPDKKKLIRINDRYGRQDTPYIASAFPSKLKLAFPLKDPFRKEKSIKCRNFHLFRLPSGRKTKLLGIRMASLKSVRINDDPKFEKIIEKRKLLLVLDGSMAISMKNKREIFLPGDGFFLKTNNRGNIIPRNGCLLLLI